MTSCKRQSHQRHGEPKLFQCTGFGDCNMVFTRSEHLARHARKHTGEKPFKCVVPGCERAFSRFDNMVQHTSTHSKHHDKKRVHGKKQNKTRLTKASSIDASNKTTPSKTLETLTPLSPPMSSSSSPQTSPDSPDSPLLSDNDVYKHQRLPSITESLYYLSPITSSMDDFPPLNSNKYIQSTCLPSPKELYLHVDSLTVSGDGHLLIGGNDYPMSTSCRKLSPTELALPIQDLSTTHGNGNVGVDVTLDEFEALQGMSRLGAELRPTTSFFDKSRNFSRVNSFRQHLPYAQNPNILHRHYAPLTL